MSKRIILVSGGSGGIGSEIVKGLAAEENTFVYFTFNSNEEKAKALETEAGADRTRGIQCNVTDMEQVKKVFETIISEQDASVDVLINAFGITWDGYLFQMQDEQWSKVIDTNLTGIYNFCRAASMDFLRKRDGSIINVSSVSGMIGIASQTNYSATKAGIIGFSKALAKEMSPRGIRVNVLAPGFIETAMTDKLDEKYKKEMTKQIPAGRFGTVEDLMGVIKLLSGNESRYITGQVFVVDGGLTMCG